MSEQQFQIPLERTANAPVTEGVHLFKIVSGEEGEGAKGAYWQFTLQCLTPGEEGKTVRHYVSLTPQSRWRLEIFLDAVGAPAKGLATLDKFIGRQFRANISHEVYEGRNQARIGEMWPASVAGGKVPAGTAVVIKSTSAEPTVTPVENTGLPTDVTGQEEIPF